MECFTGRRFRLSFLILLHHHWHMSFPGKEPQVEVLSGLDFFCSDKILLLQLLLQLLEGTHGWKKGAAAYLWS